MAKDAEDEGSDDVEYDEGDAMVVSPSAVSDTQRRWSQPVQSGPSKEANYAVAPASPTDRFIFHEDGHAHERRARIYLNEPVWPLTSPDEALLFRHFVQKLAMWVSLPNLGPQQNPILTTLKARPL